MGFTSFFLIYTYCTLVKELNVYFKDKLSSERRQVKAVFAAFVIGYLVRGVCQLMLCIKPLGPSTVIGY